MNESRHIIDILERTRFPEIGEDELARIDTHVRECPTCMRAYEAARISAGLLKARVAREVQAPEYFKTRVMAAIRENRDRQAARGFFGLWRVAGSLVSAMVAIVLVLVALNIFTPAPSRVQTAAATRNWYSVERVMEDDSVQPLDDQVSYDQALGALVEQEESNGADW